MAAIQISAFGRRFMAAWTKDTKDGAEEEEPSVVVYNSGGDFGFSPRLPDYEDAKWEFEIEEKHE